MTRAGTYVRISKDMAGESLGVARQEADCRTLATQLDWEVVEVYVDNDVSATTGKTRPSYQRMLTDLRAGHISAIIAWHPDRLYRRHVDLAELVEVAKRTNAQIATVNAGHIDLTTPTGRLVAGLLAQVAVYEGEHKSERWSRSWRQQRERGVPARTGTRMFGYTRDSVLIPEEAAIARKMAADILAGVTPEAVATELEKAGVVATRGGAWRPTTIRQYLINPRIAGWSTLHGQIVAEGTWEPILDRETFEEIRALVNSRTTSRPYVPRKFLLNGLIFCGLCDHRLISGSQGRGQRAYRCPNRPGMRGCGKVSGKSVDIDELVEKFARRRLQDPTVRQRITELRGTPSGAASEIATLELRVAELEQQLDHPGVPVTALVRAIDRAKARQRDLASTLAARNVTPLPRADEWPDELLARRGLVDLVIERVTLGAADRARGSRLGFDKSRVKIDRRLMD